MYARHAARSMSRVGFFYARNRLGSVKPEAAGVSGVWDDITSCRPLDAARPSPADAASPNDIFMLSLSHAVRRTNSRCPSFLSGLRVSWTVFTASSSTAISEPATLSPFCGSTPAVYVQMIRVLDLFRQW